MEDSVLGTLGSLDDTFVRFNLLIQTVKNKLGTALAPTIEAVVTKLSEFIKRLDWNAVAAQIVAFADKTIQVIKNIFSYLSKAFDWFMSNKDKIASALSGLGTLFGFIGTSINMVTKLADGFIAVLKTIGDIAILLGRGLVFSFGALFNSISALFNNIKMIFVNLVNAARNWGRDMIQGFINGIVSAAQALINRVKELASRIRSYLHFSRPDVGPLRDYETWMPDMLKGMANSLKANSYILDNAVAGLAGRMSANVAAGTSIGSINMSVYGAQGQSVDAIANAVMRKMYTATKQRGFSV